MPRLPRAEWRGRGKFPAPAAPAPATGTGRAGAAGDASASAEWARVVEAARREGSVAVFGPAAVQTRDALTEAFQRAYPDIRVEYDSGPPAQLPPRLLAERAPNATRSTSWLRVPPRSWAASSPTACSIRSVRTWWARPPRTSRSDHVEPFLILKDGVAYDRQQNEPYVALREELDPFIRSLMP